MHLYEEFKEYETMWDEPSQPVNVRVEGAVDNSQLEEGILLTVGTAVLNFVTDAILLVFKVIESVLAIIAGAVEFCADVISQGIRIVWSAIITVIRGGVFAFSVVEELLLLALSSLIQGFKATLATALTLFEGPEEGAKVAKLTQALENFEFEELAQQDPVLQKELEAIYDLVGPEAAQKVLTVIETRVHQQAKTLAKKLKDVTPEDLEAGKEKTVKLLRQQFDKELSKLSEAESQQEASVEQPMD